MIKAIAFDLWDTLGTKRGGLSAALSQKFNLPQTSDYLVKYETAIQLKAWTDLKDMVSNLLTTFDLPSDQANLTYVLNLFIQAKKRAELFPGMQSLLEKLAKKFKLGILSNTTVFESDIIEKWQIGKFFQSQVYSWQIQSLKPASKNFEVIASKLEVDLNQLLLIDDNIINILAAKTYGLEAIKFEGVGLLTSELLARKLI